MGQYPVRTYEDEDVSLLRASSSIGLLRSTLGQKTFATLQMLVADQSLLSSRVASKSSARMPVDRGTPARFQSAGIWLQK